MESPPCHNDGQGPKDYNWDCCLGGRHGLFLSTVDRRDSNRSQELAGVYVFCGSCLFSSRPVMLCTSCSLSVWIVHRKASFLFDLFTLCLSLCPSHIFSLAHFPVNSHFAFTDILDLFFFLSHPLWHSVFKLATVTVRLSSPMIPSTRLPLVYGIMSSCCIPSLVQCPLYRGKKTTEPPKKQQFADFHVTCQQPTLKKHEIKMEWVENGNIRVHRTIERLWFHSVFQIASF